MSRRQVLRLWAVVGLSALLTAETVAAASISTRVRIVEQKVKKHEQKIRSNTLAIRAQHAEMKRHRAQVEQLEKRVERIEQRLFRAGRQGDVPPYPYTYP